MVKRVQIRLDDSEHQELKEVKKNHGMTWKGVLLSGADAISEREYK